MGLFKDKAGKVKEAFRHYKEEHGIVAAPEAARERFGRQEPTEWLEERRIMFRQLMEAVREGRKEGLSKEEVYRELSSPDIPQKSYLRAELAADREEERELCLKRMAPEEREEERAFCAGKVKEIMEGNLKADNVPILDEETERLMKLDQVRSQMEYGRSKGLTDVELISIAVEAGIPHDEAEYMVENTLKDDVDRRFYIEEAYLQDQWEQEETLER